MLEREESTNQGSNYPLNGLRVLEWSATIAGAYTGRILHDAGSSVTRAQSAGHTRRSAFLDYLHSGKRTVVADVAELPALATELGAHIVVLELDDKPDDVLLNSFVNSVLVVITPWGLVGPYASARRPWSEFTLQVEAGSPSMRGLPDREPTVTGSSESLWIAGTMAAGAATAVVQSANAGAGRIVDVSLLEVTVYCNNLFVDVAASLNRTPHFPFAPRYRLNPGVEPASDGWVGFNLASAQNHEDFLVLIERPDYLADEEMRTFVGRYSRFEEWTEAVRSWTSRHTVAEIVELASAFRIPCSPVHNGRTVLTDPQVVARKFYEQAGGTRTLAPKPPFLFNGVRPDRHRARTTGVELDPASSTEPFSGLRVLDLSTWWVGAYVGSALGAFGADVIKVESTGRIDGARLLNGLPASEEFWWESGGIYLGANSNKRNLTLDLSQVKGHELLVRLIESADVLIENYAPRVLESMGLDWDSVHRLNPRLIMHRMPAFGLTGPRREMVGYAQTVEQFSGLCWRTGYEGGEPLNPSGPADPMGASNSFFALVAAILGRRRTGQGMLVESALAEAALVMTSEQVIRWTDEDVVLERHGNRNPRLWVQGLFPARGINRWVGVTIATETQWGAIAGIVDFGGRTGDSADLCEKLLREWISDHEAESVVEWLTAWGIPAAVLTDARFVHGHQQLVASRAYEVQDLPHFGSIPLPRLPFRWSGEDLQIKRRPPMLGEHNAEILAGELCLTAEELEGLAAAHVVGTRPARL